MTRPISRRGLLGAVEASVGRFFKARARAKAVVREGGRPVIPRPDGPAVVATFVDLAPMPMPISTRMVIQGRDDGQGDRHTDVITLWREKDARRCGRCPAHLCTFRGVRGIGHRVTRFMGPRSRAEDWVAAWGMGR